MPSDTAFLLKVRKLLLFPRKEKFPNISKLNPYPHNAMKVFSGNSNRPLAVSICGHMGVPLGEATVECFPDGETSVQINENIRGTDVFIIQSTHAPANQAVMELLLMIDAAKRASASRITAVIPFYGYSRQDRKDKSRVPISAKLVANLLVCAGASRIITLDLHSQQIVGFFDIPVDHLYAAPIFFDYLEKYRSEPLVVCTPDLGRMKMATAYADNFHCPLSMVFKRRRDAKNVEAMNLMGNVKGRSVLIVDDLIATGNTIFAAAEFLKSAGATKVRALVSHCTLQNIPLQKLSLLDELITTDSTTIATNYPKLSPNVTILSVAKLLAETIKRVHENRSVNDLFVNFE